MTNFREIIEAGEYDHYGVRAHRGDVSAVIGQELGNSRVWIDGECAEEELRGISTLKVTAANVDAMISALQSRGYNWDDMPVVLVGGYAGAYGEDADEFVIRNGVCLGVK